MATRICDTEPCDRMKEALSIFFFIDQRYDPEKGLLIARIYRKKGPAPIDVNFKYCPFCGTRAALGLVDGLEQTYELRTTKRTA